jgi:hypothetical protein
MLNCFPINPPPPAPLLPPPPQELSEEVFTKVERLFLLGLRASDPLRRQRFFDLYHTYVANGLFERLQFIICTQDWQVRAAPTTSLSFPFLSSDCIISKCLDNPSTSSSVVFTPRTLVLFPRVSPCPRAHTLPPLSPLPPPCVHRPWLAASGSSLPWT